MASDQLHAEQENSTAVIVGRKLTFEEEEQSPGLLGIQIVDSRDEDLFSEQNELRLQSSESMEDKEDVANGSTETKAVSDDAQMVSELRQALLKLRGLNRHLQRENDKVKRENTSLASDAHKASDIASTLLQENEQLKKELELLKAAKDEVEDEDDDAPGVNDTTFHSLDDDVFEFDESHSQCVDNMDPLPFTIDTNYQYQYESLAVQGSGSSDESDGPVQAEETIKLIDKSGRPNLYTYQTSDLTQHSEELQQSTTDDDEDVTLHMKLAIKSDKCDELQKDLEKFAQAFWEQSEEMDQCQRRIKKLQTENEELRCLKWVENEVDAMWLEVKKMDKAKSERRDQLEALLTERQELLDTVVEKSNEINRLKAKLANSPVPEWVQTRIDEIQEDLKQMKRDQNCLEERISEA